MRNLDLPRQIVMIDHGHYLEIIRTWRGMMAWFFVLFSAVWWYGIAKAVPGILSNPDIQGATRYIFLIHIGTGILISYFTLALLFNRTHIYANQSKMEIKHIPLPWFGNKILEAPDIEQLFSKKVVTRNKNGTQTSYKVMARMNNGKVIKLLTNLTDRNQALFIEKQFESYLGIKDEAIDGAL